MTIFTTIAAAISLVASEAPRSRDVETPGPLGPLKGTLVEAQRVPAPIALIIPGSGPTDRDGNNPLGVSAATYRLLAEALAARGVSTVRIDKRGMFGSAGAVADGNAVTIADYAQDTRSWIAKAKAASGASCIWLVGHSEGSLVALVAAQNASDVCGVVLVAGPGRRASEGIRDQLRANPANATLLEPALAAIARLEAGQRVDSKGMHPALMQLFAPQVQGFLISMFSYDPAELASWLGVPILVLQGTSDLQVGEQDALRLAAANGSARLVLLPGINHVLKQVPSTDPAANFATYSNPNLPLGEGVADTIAAFIKR